MGARLAAAVLSGVIGTGGAFALPTPGQDLAAAQIARLAATCLPDQDAVVTATAVALAESAGSPTVHGDTTITDDKWGDSVGLWQVRSLNTQSGTGGTRDATRLEDPAFNAQAMCEISSGGENWQPWSVYTSGAYRSRLAEAQAALASAGTAPLSSAAGQSKDGSWPTLGEVAEGAWQEIGHVVQSTCKAVNQPGTPTFASVCAEIGGTYTATPSGGREFTPASPVSLAGSDGLQAGFARNLSRLIGAAPGTVSIASGYRSTAEQQAIVDNHGGECGVWVACVHDGVCGSQHCRGLAADLTFEDDATAAWVHAHAADFGLTFPMAWEPWHCEPIGARG